MSGCSDGSVVQRRADRLGMRLDVPRVVMVVTSRSGGDEDVPDFRALADAFGSACPESSHPHRERSRTASSP